MLIRPKAATDQQYLCLHENQQQLIALIEHEQYIYIYINKNVFIFNSNLVGYVVWEPVQSFIKTFTRSGTSALDVPASNWQKICSVTMKTEEFLTSALKTRAWFCAFLTNGVDGGNAGQVYPWSLQHSWHSGDLAYLQTQATLHLSTHPVWEIKIWYTLLPSQTSKEWWADGW